MAKGRLVSEHGPILCNNPKFWPSNHPIKPRMLVRLVLTLRCVNWGEWSSELRGRSYWRPARGTPAPSSGNKIRVRVERIGASTTPKRPAAQFALFTGYGLPGRSDYATVTR